MGNMTNLRTLSSRIAYFRHFKVIFILSTTLENGGLATKQTNITVLKILKLLT